MKIFQLQCQGEKEFIASTSLIKAILFYHKLNGMDDQDFDDADTIEEIPQERWSELTVANSDYDPDDSKDWKSMTFEEYMKQVTLPELIASTNW